MLRYDPSHNYSVERFDISENSSWPVALRYCTPLDLLFVNNECVYTIEFYVAPTVRHIRSLRVGNLFARALNRILFDVADRFMLVAHFPRAYTPDELCGADFVLLNLELGHAVAHFQSPDPHPLCRSLLLLPREQHVYMTGRDERLYAFQYQLPSSAENAAARLASVHRAASSTSNAGCLTLNANAFLPAPAASRVPLPNGTSRQGEMRLVEVFRIGGFGSLRGQFNGCIGMSMRFSSLCILYSFTNWLSKSTYI